MAGIAQFSREAPAALLGFEQITVLTSSVGLTVPAGARGAILSPTGQNVRFRADGTAPTATIGVLLTAGDVLTIWGELEDLRFIQVAATAVLNVQYLG